MQRAWKDSLSFHQHGLLMTTNKNARDDTGCQGEDEQRDANTSRNLMPEEPSTYPPMPKVDDQMHDRI